MAGDGGAAVVRPCHPRMTGDRGGRHSGVAAHRLHPALTCRTSWWSQGSFMAGPSCRRSASWCRNELTLSATEQPLGSGCSRSVEGRCRRSVGDTPTSAKGRVADCKEESGYGCTRTHSRVRDWPSRSVHSWKRRVLLEHQLLTVVRKFVVSVA